MKAALYRLFTRAETGRWPSRRLLWAFVLFLVGMVVYAWFVEPNRFDPPPVRHQSIWDSGEPTSVQLDKARAVVSACLGDVEDFGETVYDFAAQTEKLVRRSAEAQGMTVRVIGRNRKCSPEAATSPSEADRLNLYVVDGRVAWASKF